VGGNGQERIKAASRLNGQRRHTCPECLLQVAIFHVFAVAMSSQRSLLFHASLIPFPIRLATLSETVLL
jgi:hypothetical protein